MDRTGRILLSQWVTPNGWVESDGNTLTNVCYDDKSDDEQDVIQDIIQDIIQDVIQDDEQDDEQGDDWMSFHSSCLDQDKPGEGVLA
jgi:hypothetical protein